MVLQSTPAVEAPQIGWPYTTDSMIHAFSDLRENFRIAVESNEPKSLQAHRRYDPIWHSRQVPHAMFLRRCCPSQRFRWTNYFILWYLSAKLYTLCALRRICDLKQVDSLPDNVLLAQSQVHLKDSAGRDGYKLNELEKKLLPQRVTSKRSWTITKT